MLKGETFFLNNKHMRKQALQRQASLISMKMYKKLAKQLQGKAHDFHFGHSGGGWWRFTDSFPPSETITYKHHTRNESQLNSIKKKRKKKNTTFSNGNWRREIWGLGFNTKGRKRNWVRVIGLGAHWIALEFGFGLAIGSVQTVFMPNPICIVAIHNYPIS